MTEKKRGGWTNPAAAANGKRGGRPPQIDRKPGKDGRIAIRIDPARQMVINATPEDQALAMRMLLLFPQVATVADLPMYALHRLSQMTDD